MHVVISGERVSYEKASTKIHLGSSAKPTSAEGNQKRFSSTGLSSRASVSRGVAHASSPCDTARRTPAPHPATSAAAPRTARRIARVAPGIPHPPASLSRKPLSFGHLSVSSSGARCRWLRPPRGGNPTPRPSADVSSRSGRRRRRRSGSASPSAGAPRSAAGRHLHARQSAAYRTTRGGVRPGPSGPSRRARRRPGCTPRARGSSNGIRIDAWAPSSR